MYVYMYVSKLATNYPDHRDICILCLNSTFIYMYASGCLVRKVSTVEKVMYVTIIWTAVLLVSCASTSSALQTYESIDDLVISSDYLYVTDGPTLHFLHNNLTHLCSLAMGNATISRIAVNTDETFIIVCLVDGICKSHQIESLLKTNSSTLLNVSADKAAAPTVKRVALTVTSNSSFYVGYTKEANKRAIILQQFKYDGNITFQVRTTEVLITNSGFISRDFYDAFKNGHFIYYITVDTIGNETRLTVMRVCDDKEEHFSAVMEVELNCGTTTPIMFSVTHSLLVRDHSSTMVVITTSSKSVSRVCGYQLTDIDMELQRTYNECISSGIKNPLPWEDYDHAEDCSRLTKQGTTECNFGSTITHSFTPTLSARNSINGSILLEMVDEVTATLVLHFDSIQFLYVAHTNTSGYYLTQYYMWNDNMKVSLMEVETINSAVHHLRYNDEYIYAATDNEVFVIALDDCSSYTDCVSCIKNHICGWCTLEGMCSRRTNCPKSHLRNRWTRSSNSCISHVILLQPHSAVTPLTANITVTPTSATFPEIDPSEEYKCQFVNSVQNYSFTLPFVDGKYCDASAALIPSFGFKQIELQLHILSQSGDNKDFASFSANNTLTVYNCSFSSRCSECAAMGVCGWCIYDNTCTGSNTLCQTLADWRSISVLDGSRSRCPALLTPKHGWYLQSVGVSNELKLYTRNLPLLIPGYKYICELRDPSGLSVVINAINSTPMNESQAICQIEQNQITIPELSMTGVMALRLNLVLANDNGSFSHVIEWEKGVGDGNLYSDGNMMEESPTNNPLANQTFFNMLIFNCSYFGHDCSSCLAAASGTNLPCVWCQGDNPNSGRCVDLHVSKCLEAVVILNDHQCPHPQITSVSPTSGHIDGGTVLTISGSNLGVTVNDVSVLIGIIECPLLQARYKPGKVIVCTTNRSSSEGEMTITVQIRRALTVITSTYHSFNYALPHVALVHPRYGPVSGGTVVIISGSALDVGNIEAIRIIIAESICEIVNITSMQLICKTSKKDNHGIGMILIEYGSARVSGENYLYTPNPKLTSIFPHNTIPAGGIALNFTGHNLNVTQNPRIVIYIGNNSYSNTCRTNEGTSLHCTAPTLPSLMHILETIVLNYTLIMDSAPGPHTGEEELLLSVKPNPVLVEVEVDSRTYITGSDDTITIIGKNLDAVDLSEIKVYIGEYTCSLTLVTPMLLKCKPDISIISSTPQTKEIKVYISSTLEYNVGYIEILNNGTMDSGSGFSQIIAAVVAVIIIMVTFIIAFCVFVIATCMCLKKKSREFRLKQVPMERNYFGGLGDELYDHIEDAPKDIVCKERKLNNYLYNTNEGANPSNNNNRQDTRSTRGSLPQIPRAQLQDDYVDMQSHSVQLQRGLNKRNAPMHCQHQQASRTGSSGEYVAMLPASRPECKHSSEDYVDIEEMPTDHK